MAVRHDSKLNFTAYPTGLKVWVRDHTAAVGGKPKLGLPFKGPVTIVERRGTPGEEVTYRIQDVRGKTRVVHHNDLKEFIPRRTDLRPVQDPSGPNGRGGVGRQGHEKMEIDHTELICRTRQSANVLRRSLSISSTLEM
ncbi:hypothetical protein FJT64_008212 [Amphibalanus amphitrite]|uniref:Uncharacterized protein n=1 Tax=Amphibalanus amphitrite TaxID=1232801 RepID=A0A6A4VTK1_AMPAM|nr:hypothetical protein FJT64_008212 [Amphibalanus amphitrite]